MSNNKVLFQDISDPNLYTYIDNLPFIPRVGETVTFANAAYVVTSVEHNIHTDLSVTTTVFIKEVKTF